MTAEERAVTGPIRVEAALVHVRPGQTTRADLQVAGGRVVTAGPGTRHHDGRAPVVIDGRGASVVPLFVDTVFDGPSPPRSDAFDLAPGQRATFAVIRGSVAVHSIRSMLVVDPADLVAVVVAGTVVARDGEVVAEAADELGAGDDRLGAWTDPRRDMTQHLTADGRYTETRGGRPDAYTGRFWLRGDRITYRDDTGFWAFGQYHDGVLHHAGYVLRRDQPAA